MWAGRIGKAAGTIRSGLTPAAAMAAKATRAAERSSSWWNSAGYNARLSAAVAKRFIGRGNMASISRWAMVGAGIGAIRGATDNLMGQDRVSVLGGAMQGAITLGGLRAMKVGFNKGAAGYNKWRLAQKTRAAGIGGASAMGSMQGPYGAGIWRQHGPVRGRAGMPPEA